jgi:hypothetical protein
MILTDLGFNYITMNQHFSLTHIGNFRSIYTKNDFCVVQYLPMSYNNKKD